MYKPIEFAYNNESCSVKRSFNAFCEKYRLVSACAVRIGRHEPKLFAVLKFLHFYLTVQSVNRQNGFYGSKLLHVLFGIYLAVASFFQEHDTYNCLSVRAFVFLFLTWWKICWKSRQFLDTNKIVFSQVGLNSRLLITE